MLYSQLSPSAQERARDWYRENIAIDYEWWDSTYDHWKAKLAELGFADAEIRFSGFSSQGDGASFTATITREIKLPPGLLARLEECRAVRFALSRFAGERREIEASCSITAKIIRDIHSRYVHQHTIDAELSIEYGWDVSDETIEAIDSWARETEKSLTEEARDLSTEIYRELESDWDAIQADDYVAEQLLANDYHFDEDGNQCDAPDDLAAAA
jgi:hypothetical protein